MTLSLDLIHDFVRASHGNLEKVKTLLAETPDLLTARSDWGEDGLGAAAHIGNRAIAEFLLAQGAPLTICAAAMLGHLEDVKVILVADPSAANAKGAHDITVMFHAALSGDIRIAQVLLDADCKEGFNHALHGAISCGHKDMVHWLLEHGVSNVNSLDHQSKTPLASALEMKQDEIVELLRQYNAKESA